MSPVGWPGSVRSATTDTRRRINNLDGDSAERLMPYAHVLFTGLVGCLGEVGRFNRVPHRQA